MNENNFSQVKVGLGGGYIFNFDQRNLFVHNKDGLQSSIALIYPLSDAINLTGRFIYQSRTFNQNSFSFVIPLVAGYSYPSITDGENLKSYGLILGARISSSKKSSLNTYLISEAGFISFSNSYYWVNETTKVKYSESKTLFEYSLGIGVSLNIINNFILTVDGRIAHIPNEKIFYSPINLGIELPL
jgi:hypothetical protein